MTDFAALAAIEWPDDGWSTRAHNDDEAGAYKLAQIMRYRITPWPSIELFPRIAKAERFITDWRYRFSRAWSALRGCGDYQW